MFKNIKVSLLLFLMMSLASPASFAGKKQSRVGAVLWRFAEATVVLLVSLDPVEGEGKGGYCNQLQIMSDSNNCITQATCLQDTFQFGKGFCSVWNGANSDCSSRLGGRYCKVTCDQATLDKSADLTCNQLIISADNNGSFSASCTVTAPALSHYNDENEVCESFQPTGCAKSEQNLTNTALTCNRFDMVDNVSCFLQSTLVARARSANSDEIVSIPMSKLKIGDRVVSQFDSSGGPIWTTVDMIPHRDSSFLTHFIRLSTHSSSLSLTKTHYIPVIGKDGIQRSVQAGELSVGDQVISKMGLVPILDVVSVPAGMKDESGVLHVGVEHPVTKSNTIVVKQKSEDEWMVANTHAEFNFPNTIYYVYQARNAFHQFIYGKAANGTTPLERRIIRAFLLAN